MERYKNKTLATSYTGTQKIIALIIYIIGMLICGTGLIVSFLLRDYSTTIAIGIDTIIITTTFIFLFLHKKYSEFFTIVALVNSVLVFPLTMALTIYPQQGILYQFLAPILWTLSISNKNSKNILPISCGIWLSLVDGYKIYLLLGLSQGIEYAVIFLAVYMFIYFITKIYNTNVIYAYNQLNDSASIDYLTGTYNRFGISSKMEKLVSSNIPFYLIYIDLDNFKNINDTLGHSTGDDILLNLTKSWKYSLSNVSNTIGRLGGDEFVILIETEDSITVDESIQKLMEDITTSKDALLNKITLSAGIVSFPKDGKSVSDLFKYVDTALYKSKSLGKNTYQFFDKDLYNDIIRGYQLKSELERCLSNNDLYLVYQPQVDIKTNKIYGFEALLRLNLDNSGIQDFINQAEKSTLIYDIDLYVLNKAMRDCYEMVKINKDLVISVNISGKHLVYRDLSNDIRNILIKNDFPAENLCIEITESSFIKSLNIAKANIQKLSKLGIKIALDDFGMGYSSLAYLSELRVNHIKIEKFFIDSLMDKDKKNKKSKLPDIIIKLGHLFHYKVIAEGVEDISELEYLKKHKCDIIQGYIYSKPLKVEEAKQVCNKTF